jgi:hypothetical protein
LVAGIAAGDGGAEEFQSQAHLVGQGHGVIAGNAGAVLQGVGAHGGAIGQTVEPIGLAFDGVHEILSFISFQNFTASRRVLAVDSTLGRQLQKIIQYDPPTPFRLEKWSTRGNARQAMHVTQPLAWSLPGRLFAVVFIE